MRKLSRLPAPRLIGSLSSTLGRNLAKAGRGALKGLEQAHHIVAQASKNPFAVRAREILKSVGIGIHDADNGVAVANELHARLHTDSNYRDVANRLESAVREALMPFEPNYAKLGAR